MKELLQKYQPIFLLALAILFGGLLLLQKGFLKLPTFGKKTGIVNLKSPAINIFFSGKEYKLSYAGTNSANLATIVKFDKSEQWQGSGSVEKANDEIGGSILTLIDRDRKGTSAYILKSLNLSSIDTIKFNVNLRSDSSDVESLNLLIGSKDGKKFYRFPITNLQFGVNYFNIPKHSFFLVEESTEAKQSVTSSAERVSFGWDKIERVQLELFSRPTSKASVEVGWIRGEKDDFFTPDWSWDGNEHFLNLVIGPESKPILLVQSIGRSIATFRKVGSVKNFSYSAKILSLKKGNTGLFFRGDYKTGYGYYFVVGGLGTSEWSIIKYYLVNNQTKIENIITGQIGNFEFTKDQPFWLKVVTKGSSINAYFSLDGKDYTKLVEVSDTSFSAGGVGVVAINGGVGYFDEFDITQ